MNWKFWQKDTGPEFIIETEDVPTSTLLRWFLYDSAIPNPNKHAKALGFNPISAEGEEMELRESIARLERLNPYLEYIALASDISGQMLAETFTDVLSKAGLIDPDDPSEDHRDALAELYTTIALSCLVPAFSSALHLGIIVNPGAYVSGAYNE